MRRDEGGDGQLRFALCQMLSGIGVAQKVIAYQQVTAGDLACSLPP